MKTGPQSDIFDYNTGEWNNSPDAHKIPQTTNMVKPPFAAVTISLRGESFEEQLIRLGKIRRREDRSNDAEERTS